MRTIRWSLAVLLTALLLSGCSKSRAQKSQQALLQQRTKNEQAVVKFQNRYIDRLITQTRAEYELYNAKKRHEPPVVDLLIISGGGDWGAFGAGFLKGWGRVSGELARPKFDAVTGVSTGALIAPFAFLGDDQSIDVIGSIYRNPKKNWVKRHWPFFFLPSNESFATVPGLEKELRERLTDTMLRRIADEWEGGRGLMINTTDLDNGDMWVWDVGEEANKAINGGNPERVMNILLASAGIPAAFPARIIDDTMYVDGGITGNILYGGRTREDQSFHALWKQRCPDLPMPKVRYWVIFNNQIKPPPQVTERKWPAVLSRSMVMSSRSATLTSMRHLFSQAELWRLKYKADIEIRIAAVPDGWEPPEPGVFNKTVMNTLTDMGEKAGADPKSWITQAP